VISYVAYVFLKVLCVSSRNNNTAAEAITYKKNPVAITSVSDWFVNDFIICHMLLDAGEIVAVANLSVCLCLCLPCSQSVCKAHQTFLMCVRKISVFLVALAIALNIGG